MLVEEVTKFFKEEYDLNCAETMVYAANEEYDLNLSKETLKAMASFGGSTIEGSFCGAVIGARVIIGILFTDISGHKSPKVKTLANEFMEKFNKELGYLHCVQLKEKYQADEVRCLRMVQTAGKILEEIVTREKR